MSAPPNAPKTDAANGQRIAKLLARSGIASRREIERMIAEGRIALDGKPLDTPATIVTSLRGITVDGKPVAQAEPARLFIFHKPPGLLTTERDPKGRPTIYDRLPRDLPRLVPVGRLDLATEGLLLMTTDGELKRQLELPATGVERSYRARTYGTVTQAQLEELIEGIEIDGIRYGSIDANLERRTGANVSIELTLTEGKNREVRRVLEHLGLQVSRLIRTRYGPFVLGDMPPGEIGEIRQHDLVAFRKTLKLPAAQRKYEPVEARTEKKLPPRPIEQAPPVEERRPQAQARRPGKPKPPPRKPREDNRPANPARAARAKAFRNAHEPERPSRGPTASAGEGRPAAQNARRGAGTPGTRGRSEAPDRRNPRDDGPRKPARGGRPDDFRDSRPDERPATQRRNAPASTREARGDGQPGRGRSGPSAGPRGRQRDDERLVDRPRPPRAARERDGPAKPAQPPRQAPRTGAKPPPRGKPSPPRGRPTSPSRRGPKK